MSNITRLIPISIFLFLLIVPSISNAAEVYYVGGAQGQTATEEYPSYSFKQRVRDLFDFQKSKKNPQDSSGQISGTFLQEVDWNDVTGNESKSFLEKGTDYLTELNLAIMEKLRSNYRFEGQVFLRKTDNRRIEPRKDIRIKQYDLKIVNPDNLYQFGDFYGDYSSFVLSDSLEGLNIELKPTQGQEYGLVVAKSQGPDSAASIFQRNVFGFKSKYSLFPFSEIFNKFNIGFQIASSQDDSSTNERTSSTKDLNNTVFGIDGQIGFRKLLSFDFELARSHYIEDEDTTGEKTQDNGTAFRIQPKINFGKMMIRYLYYCVYPKFYSDTGSAASDKRQHQVNVDFRLTDLMKLNLTNNFYWDHLKGSTKTKRTTNHDEQVALQWKPFLSKPDFLFRPYIGYYDRYSDDAQTTVESITRTAGFSINSSLDEKTSFGLNYEFREYRDDANKSNSDYNNRFGFNLGKETQFIHRRLYYSIGSSFDLRRTKTDSNTDFNATFSGNGQWHTTDNMIMRFGFNMQNTNSSQPGTDYLNTQDYLECDYSLVKNKDTHFILRGENNRYDHEDGNQEYREYRAILKILTRF